MSLLQRLPTASRQWPPASRVAQQVTHAVHPEHDAARRDGKHTAAELPPPHPMLLGSPGLTARG